MNIIINGVTYHFEACGTGFPLLSLHGFTGNGESWMRFCKIWGSHSSIIAPDLLGHGKTELSKDPDRYEIESSASDLKMILDSQGIEKTDLLGYSMGGRLALAFAILYPEMVRKLILVSASPGLETESEQKDRRMKDGKLANFIKDQGIEAFVDYWENIPLFSSLQSHSAAVRESVRKQRLGNATEGLANSLIGMGTGRQPSYWDELVKLECEVLLLTGEFDEKFKLIAEKMKKKLGNCRHVVFDSCGHAIHVEQSEKFGTIVSEFLSNT